MYFTPSKKTYYRFPSTFTAGSLDARFYFPQKPDHTVTDNRLDENYIDQLSDYNDNRDFHLF